MTQLTIFQDTISHHQKPAHWVLYTDGAARNNPGPAGAGIYLLKSNSTVLKAGWYLGSKTNNQAEYIAVLAGLCVLRKHAQEGDALEIRADSELLIRQLLGIYKVKNLELKKLFEAVQEQLRWYKATFVHVNREQNHIADELANQGIDTKRVLPEYVIACMERYGISL